MDKRTIEKLKKIKNLWAYELATGRLYPEGIHNISLDGRLYKMGYKELH